MAARDDLTLPLEPEAYYHIYNRGNNKNNIFFEEANYSFFLKRYVKYTDAYLDTFCYCLLPNHFHFLIRVKKMDKILSTAKKSYLKVPQRLLYKLRVEFPNLDFPDFENLENLIEAPPLSSIEKQLWQYQVACWLISEQLRKFFLSYTKAVNKKANREGSLMRKNFRRKPIDDNSYLKYLIWYIHNNPVHHGIWTDLKTYPWSSYELLMSHKQTWLRRKEILAILEGRENALIFHQKNWERKKGLREFVIEK